MNVVTCKVWIVGDDVLGVPHICRIGIRSRLRPRSGSALTATGSHSLPTRSNPFQSNRKQKTPSGGWCLFFFGCRIGIRTPTNRVRVCRATVTQFGNVPRTHYSIASSRTFVKIFFKKIENFPSGFSRVAKKSKLPFTKVHKCGKITSY